MWRRWYILDRSGYLIRRQVTRGTVSRAGKVGEVTRVGQLRGARGGGVGGGGEVESKSSRRPIKRQVR